MIYVWNETKRRENQRKHGVDFSAAEDLDWENAITFEDVRERYPERRWVAFAPIGAKLHVLIFTEPEENVTRVISLREATKKERKLYVQEISATRG